MLKHRARAVFLLIFAVLIGYFVYSSNTSHPFRLGLDLSGGTHLVYQADVSKIPSANVSDAMTALRDDVEHRVNALGVSEALVQTEQGAALSSAASAYKLIVELPGVTDSDEAVKQIGATPELDFRLVSAQSSTLSMLPLRSKLNPPRLRLRNTVRSSSRPALPEA